ncbi:MAG: hypothetical protein FWD53_05765 [Phycisphaerales bacterium]|nr:hypothetical protein [Phycisphaerales bacterium]
MSATSLICQTPCNRLQQAFDEIESVRRSASQRHLCLMEVWKRPGHTAAEIATLAGLARHVPSRRLPELRQAGQIKCGAERVCAVTGNPSMTWFPCVENN